MRFVSQASDARRADLYLFLSSISSLKNLWPKSFFFSKYTLALSISLLIVNNNKQKSSQNEKD